MEIKVVIKEIVGNEIVVETEAKETIRLPKRLVASPELNKEIYLNIEEEVARRPRELLNEILTT